MFMNYQYLSKHLKKSEAIKSKPEWGVQMALIQVKATLQVYLHSFSFANTFSSFKLCH